LVLAGQKLRAAHLLGPDVFETEAFAVSAEIQPQENSFNTKLTLLTGCGWESTAVQND
jgi:hypothetical protein